MRYTKKVYTFISVVCQCLLLIFMLILLQALYHYQAFGVSVINCLAICYGKFIVLFIYSYIHEQIKEV